MTIDTIDLYGGEETRELHKQIAEENHRQEADDFKWLMSDARGRRFVWRLIAITGVFRCPYAGEDSATNFQSGQQSIGQTILADVMEHTPEKFDTMITEKKKHDARIADRVRRKTE